MEKITGVICGPRLYDYEGWFFEFHSHLGPWPLTKDGSPFKRAGKKFYDMFHRFNELAGDEKDKFMVGGGCVRF